MIETDRQTDRKTDRGREKDRERNMRGKKEKSRHYIEMRKKYRERIDIRSSLRPLTWSFWRIYLRTCGKFLPARIFCWWWDTPPPGWWRRSEGWLGHTCPGQHRWKWCQHSCRRAVIEGGGEREKAVGWKERAKKGKRGREGGRREWRKGWHKQVRRERKEHVCKSMICITILCKDPQ